jgi:hypothetical protein
VSDTAEAAWLLLGTAPCSGETSGCWCRRTDSGRPRGRFPPRPQLGPRLSETRSDDQELREAEAAGRRLRNSERNCGEGRTREGYSEPTRNESGQRQDDGWYQQQQEAQIHRGSVIVHPALVLIEAAEPGGEDE